jgi:hypothetical protein
MDTIAVAARMAIRTMKAAPITRGIMATTATIE